MSVQGQSQLSLRGHDNQQKFLTTVRERLLSAKREEGGFVKLQASQPHLSPWEGEESDVSGSHLQT